MDLHEFINAPAVTCPANTGLADVARLMETHDVGSVIIVDPDGTVAGIITDRDLVIRGIARTRALETPVGEIMTTTVVSLRDDADPFDAARQMAMSECRRLPVVGKDGALKGVVALDDLTVLFARQLDNLATAVASETASPTRPS